MESYWSSGDDDDAQVDTAKNVYSILAPVQGIIIFNDQAT